MKWTECVSHFTGVNSTIIVASTEHGVFHFGRIRLLTFGLAPQFDLSMVKHVRQNGSVVVYGIYKSKSINSQYIHLVYTVYDNKRKCFSRVYTLWHRIISQR